MAALLLCAFCARARAEGGWELRRAEPSAPEAQRWFSARDRLLDALDARLWALADGAAVPTAGRARAAAEALRADARAFSDLSGERGALEAADEAAAALMALLAGLPDDAPLPAPAREKLYGLKSGVHRLLRLMSQRALELPGPSGSAPVNLLASAQGRLVELPALDLSGLPLENAGRALRPLLPAALRGLPKGSAVVLSSRRRWLRVPGGELYLYAASGAAGGTVRLSLREDSGSADAQASFYLLSRALYDAGFAVSVENGEILATLEGSRSALDADAFEERWGFAARALAESLALRSRLGNWLKGTVSRPENALRLDALARILVAEGGFDALPEWADSSVGTAPAAGLSAAGTARAENDLRAAPAAGLSAAGTARAENDLRAVPAAGLVFDGAGFVPALERYRAREGDRQALRGRVERTLAALKLPPFPDLPLGRRTLALHYEEPLEAGLALGELRLEGGRPVRASGFDPLGALAREGTPLSASASARLAPMLAGARPLAHGASAAFLRLVRVGEGRWTAAFIGLGAGGRPERALFRAAARGTAPQPLSTEKALAALETAGALRPAPSAPPAPLSRPAVSAGKGIALDARALLGGASVEAELTFDRNRALEGGRIYATPYAAGADETALSRSKGLLVTGSSPQSVLLAAAAGIPALELLSARWESGGLRAAAPGGTLLLREGVRVRLDPSSGLVECSETSSARVPEKLKALPPLAPAAK